MPCEKCGSTCRGLISVNNPRASEWYCSECHKSYLMSEEDFLKHLDMRNGK